MRMGPHADRRDLVVVAVSRRWPVGADAIHCALQLAPRDLLAHQSFASPGP